MRSRLREFVQEALQIAEDKGVQELLAFATSAVRDAANGDECSTGSRPRARCAIQVLPGPDESRLTFLAARRWFGWSSGRLLLLDIGGGSLEIASGQDEEPLVAVSLPLGANRLTRDWLHRRPAGPGRGAQAAQARPGRDRRDGQRDQVRRRTADHFVATSKTFRQLARIAGAAPSSEGPFVKRVLRHADVTELADRLARMSIDAAGPAARRLAGCGRRSSPRARSSPMPRWTCSASPSWRSARGPCARA